jgi:molecular chaperone GrpE
MTNQDINPETAADVAETATSAPASGTPDADTADGAAAAAVQEARNRIAIAEGERDEHLDRLRRMAADFDNYKKRQAREREQVLAQANERLVTNLLPVFDDLERALEAFEGNDPEQIRQGVALVHRALHTVLEREGITEIDPGGERFDPHEHEALTTQVVPGTAEGTVLQVIQRGFKLGDRVVRPARVIVAAAPDGG